MRHSGKLQMSDLGPTATAAWALTATFVTYFCMYAFRKPFTAATFDDAAGWPFAADFKSVLIICQVSGYALSKFIGIRVVSEAENSGRAKITWWMIVASEAALAAFAVLPAALKPAAMFANGLSLGMIWGLVYRYVEGRRNSEILGAGLCTSFILASGYVKSAGSFIIERFGVSEFWMPALVGLLFLPVTGLAILALASTPEPDAADQAVRSAREPMSRADRARFFRDHGPGLVLLTLSFTALGALRDFRDNFAADIWKSVGFKAAPAVFAYSETPAALCILLAIGLVGLVRDNQRAVTAIHLLMALGIATALAATLAFQLGAVGPLTWMVVIGAGIYLGYVPATSVLADRLIASLHSSGNTGFMIYLLDAWAYGGSVTILLFRAAVRHGQSWGSFMVWLSYACLLVGLVATLGSMVYFRRGAPSDAPVGG